MAVAALAQATPAQPAQTGTGVGEPGVVPQGNSVPPKRSPAHYLWAVLIAFVTEGTQIEKILNHIGVDPEPPHISPARGPPLWDDCGDAQTVEGVEIEPDWDLAAQAAPNFEVDQRINW